MDHCAWIHRDILDILEFILLDRPLASSQPFNNKIYYEMGNGTHPHDNYSLHSPEA